MKSTNLILCLTCTCLATLFVFESHLLAGNGVEVVGSKFDFGYVPFGSEVKHKVILINHSDSILRIANVRTGCGCTRIPLRKKTAAPGDTLEIEISLNTAQVNKGQFTKSPTIFINNAETPEITVSITGYNYLPNNLPSQVRVSPQILKLSKGSGEAMGEIEVRNLGSYPIQARPVTETANKYYTVELPARPIPGGGSGRIVVKLTQESKDSDFSDSFTFLLTDEKRSRFTVPVLLLP